MPLCRVLRATRAGAVGSRRAAGPDLEGALEGGAVGEAQVGGDGDERGFAAG
ncbi:hypothetical protein SDC9_150259 [bioreactor metagenome]|uniref:Uncharacterized protein n=1 Tax=bioreactor metagenome TaxID=1076179 RepID=A0A645ENL7_9ZZZZ